MQLSKAGFGFNLSFLQMSLSTAIKVFFISEDCTQNVVSTEEYLRGDFDKVSVSLDLNQGLLDSSFQKPFQNPSYKAVAYPTKGNVSGRKTALLVLNLLMLKHSLPTFVCYNF